MKFFIKLTWVEFRGSDGIFSGGAIYINPSHIVRATVQTERSMGNYTLLWLTQENSIRCMETPEEIEKLARFG